MPSLSKFIDSAKNTFRKRKDRRKSSTKSVRFSSIGSDSIFYTHSSLDYDRRSSISFSEINEADSLKSSTNDENDLCSTTSEFDEQVLRNTKVNKKQGYHSIAALVSYRANI